MTTPPPETTNSTVTAWIPLATTAPAPYPPCWNESFTEFHVDEGPLDGNLIGFDPLLTALTIGTTYITCQPDQVTRWYENRLATLVPDGILPTVTSIQPLVCPSQWSTALNTTVGNSVQITCCPSGYTADPVDRQYEANCISEFAPGQTFGYFYPNERIITTTYTVPITVAAVAIKGWNTIVGATATTSADLSSSSDGNSNSSGLHGGAIAGIVIGIVAAAALIGAGIVFFLRRRRRRGRNVGETAEAETKTSELGSKQYVNVPQDPGHRLGELATSSNTPELYTDYNPHSPRGDDAEIHELQ